MGSYYDKMGVWGSGAQRSDSGARAERGQNRSALARGRGRSGFLHDVVTVVVWWGEAQKRMGCGSLVAFPRWRSLSAMALEWVSLMGDVVSRKKLVRHRKKTVEKFA